MTSKQFIWDLSSTDRYGSRTKQRSLIPHYCEICGYAITPPTKHRIKPGKDQGKYVPGNVIGACPSCHNQCDRGMIPPVVLFMIVQARLRREALTKECWACQRTRSLREFADEPGALDGKHNECRECMNGFKVAGFLDQETKMCLVCAKPRPLEAFSDYPFADDLHRPECSACLAAVVTATRQIAKMVLS